jgi:hypothetical protein
MGRTMSERSRKKEIVIPERRNLPMLILGIGILTVGPVAGVGLLLVGGNECTLCTVALLAPVALIFVGLYVFRAVRRRRLVLTRDCLLLIQGSDDVIGQIPYEFISSVTWDEKRRLTGVPTDSHKYILALVLRHLENREIWWPEVLEGEKYDIEIKPGFDMALSDLKPLLEERVENAPRSEQRPRKRGKKGEA